MWLVCCQELLFIRHVYTDHSDIEPPLPMLGDCKCCYAVQRIYFKLFIKVRAGLRDCGALGKVVWGGPPKEVVANHSLSICEQKLSMHKT